MKHCPRCDKDLSVSEFNPSRRDGYQSYCRLCQRAYREENFDRISRQNRNSWYKYRYGITIEDYETLQAAQGGQCGICKADDVALVVDHCHKTNKVRGLLCDDCNVGIGRLRDDPWRLERALEWVR